jgi:hypothetical protein
MTVAAFWEIMQKFRKQINEKKGGAALAQGMREIAD